MHNLVLIFDISIIANPLKQKHHQKPMTEIPIIGDYPSCYATQMGLNWVKKKAPAFAEAFLTSI